MATVKTKAKAPAKAAKAANAATAEKKTVKKSDETPLFVCNRDMRYDIGGIDAEFKKDEPRPLRDSLILEGVRLGIEAANDAAKPLHKKALAELESK